MTDYEKLIELLDKANADFEEGQYFNRVTLPCKLICIQVENAEVMFYFNPFDEIVMIA